MLEEGLVELAADPKDMRVTLVYLTDAGRATDRENIEKIKATDAIGLSGISEDEARTLMSLLGRIRDNLLMCEGENEKNI
jgi:DNA-binding MarR family transcriptional regulator